MLDNVPISNPEIYEINEIVDSADFPVVLVFLERQGHWITQNYLATLFTKMSILDECQSVQQLIAFLLKKAS